MKRARKSLLRKQRSFALVFSMIFVLVLSAFAAAMLSMSGTNMQIADNHRKAHQAFANAESGLEVLRFWLSHIKMPVSTPVADYFDTIVADLRADLTANGIGFLNPQIDGSIPPVDLSGNTGTFSAQLQVDPECPTVLQVYITGAHAGINRTIRVDYDIVPFEYPIFDFGLATKGPLHFTGNPTLIGANAAWEADVYIESSGALTAVSVGGNTNFDGDINISNPLASADFQGDVLIAGDHGEEAIANHVFTGVEPPEFPVPDTDRFRPYATGVVIDASTDTTKGMTIANGIIPAGTNPTFDGSVTIQGILFIEQPNIVTFGRNLSLQGMIVADGDIESPGTNSINVLGNFSTAPFPSGDEFDAIRHEIGSSIIAPGFSASFSGNYSTIEGVVAVSGAHFSGNANAVVKGSIINYSDTPTVIEGNTTMIFDRLDSTRVPAGFDTHRVLDYDPSSYSMIH